MNHDSMRDDIDANTAPNTPSAGAIPSADVSPDAVHDWQPRNSAHRGDPRWHRRHWTWVLVGVALLIMVLVAVVLRRGANARKAAPAVAANASAAQGMSSMQPSSDGAVALTPKQIQQFGVTFGTVEQRTLTNEIRTAGIVTADQAKLASVTPRFGGYIERLYVNSMGQPVHKGQPLAAVYSPDVLAAEQELLLARGLDRTLLTSSIPGVPGTPADLVTASRRRLQLWGVSAAQIDDVLRTGKPSPTVTLYSPTSGFVTEMKVVQGQAIQAGMDLYTITDLSQVWVDAEIREADAALVRVGALATLSFAAYPGKQYVGRVGYIYPTVAAQSRTLNARIVVSNSSGILKPGMYATVNIATPTRGALTVPSSAVVQTGERSLVFFDVGGGRLAPHDVGVGRTSGDYTEILSGVEAGQRVVTSAQFLIDSESNLGEVMKSMIGAGSSSNGSRGGSDTEARPDMSAPSTSKPR